MTQTDPNASLVGYGSFCQLISRALDTARANSSTLSYAEATRLNRHPRGRLEHDAQIGGMYPVRDWVRSLPRAGGVAELALARQEMGIQTARG
jgi:hypothetical protein